MTLDLSDSHTVLHALILQLTNGCKVDTSDAHTKGHQANISSSIASIDWKCLRWWPWPRHAYRLLRMHLAKLFRDVAILLDLNNLASQTRLPSSQISMTDSLFLQYSVWRKSFRLSTRRWKILCCAASKWASTGGRFFCLCCRPRWPASKPHRHPLVFLHKRSASRQVRSFMRTALVNSIRHWKKNWRSCDVEALAREMLMRACLP